jgi:hypothetical protein
MRGVTGLVIAAALLVACGDVRVGMERSPIGAVDSDQAVLEAIRHALSPDEQTCQLELVTLVNTPQGSESTSKQVASAVVCGRSQKFSIQRSQINADSILIAAKKI